VTAMLGLAGIAAAQFDATRQAAFQTTIAASSPLLSASNVSITSFLDEKLQTFRGAGARRGGATYPAHWGSPPAIQTEDYRELPGGYGFGSSTLSAWITNKMVADEASMSLKQKKKKMEWSSTPWNLLVSFKITTNGATRAGQVATALTASLGGGGGGGFPQALSAAMGLTLGVKVLVSPEVTPPVQDLNLDLVTDPAPPLNGSTATTRGGGIPTQQELDLCPYMVITAL